jgi:hypothetical protein
MYPGAGCGYGGACYSPYAAPYGAGGVVAPTSAYYPATTISAAVPVPAAYAVAPAYPMTAAVPLEILPTY